MKDFGRQRSTVAPESLVIDEFSVWVHSDVVPIEETIGEEVFTGFEFGMIQYEKNEYIKGMSEKNQSMELQLTDTQVALIELYEGMVV